MKKTVKIHIDTWVSVNEILGIQDKDRYPFDDKIRLLLGKNARQLARKRSNRHQLHDLAVGESYLWEWVRDRQLSEWKTIKGILRTHPREFALAPGIGVTTVTRIAERRPRKRYAKG